MIAGHRIESKDRLKIECTLHHSAFGLGMSKVAQQAEKRNPPDFTMQRAQKTIQNKTQHGTERNKSE